MIILVVVIRQPDARRQGGADTGNIDATAPGVVDGDQCRLDSDCPPGSYCDVDAAHCTFDCRMHSDCDPRGGLTSLCINGRCVVASEQCGEDLDCGPPSSICIRGACVAGCAETGCPDGRECSSVSGRCVALPGVCSDDRDCPMGEVCNLVTAECMESEDMPGHCAGNGDCPEGRVCNTATGQCQTLAECTRNSDCPLGAICDPATFRCVNGTPAASNLPLGSDCRADSECASGQCLALLAAGNPVAVCTKICCVPRDCPAGFGCLYFNGVQQCFPSRIFPDGTEFTGEAGAPCTPSSNTCKSGLCGPDNFCLQTCCTFDDCGGIGCRFLPVGDGSTTRPVCDVFTAIFGQPVTGLPCQSQLDCGSGVCLPVSGGAGAGICADLCCSPSDCPGGFSCVQADVHGGIAHACALVPVGNGAFGSQCSGPDGGGECISGLCIGKRCTTVCCEDADCPDRAVCRSQPNGEGSRIRVCVSATPAAN